MVVSFVARYRASVECNARVELDGGWFGWAIGVVIVGHNYRSGRGGDFGWRRSYVWHTKL